MATPVRKTPTHGGPRAAAGRKNPRAKIAVPGNRSIKLVRSITIRKPAAELYAFWRDLENLMRVIKHRVSIKTKSPEESHWIVNAPARRTTEWDALVINDVPDRLIAWRSRDGADVPNAGSVRFEPVSGGDATEVTVQLEYNPPGGRLGAFVAKLTRDSVGTQVSDTLRRLKTLMETGDEAS